MSHLNDHAETELRRAGLFDADSDYDGMLGPAVLELVRTFAGQGHSGMSANLTLALFDNVARFKPLSPLTDDPAEWQLTTGGPPMWQSRRQSDAFSEDGGKTYYTLDDRTPKPTKPVEQESTE